MSTYCDRCRRWFRSARGKQQHERDSSRHNCCPVCSLDHWTRGDLLQHYRDTGHRIVCSGCYNGAGANWEPDSQGYRDHLVRQNVCRTCERHFDSPSNLQHHEMVHLEPSIRCFGCTRTFTTLGGMIIHLEANTCSSGLNLIHLNHAAAECYQWRHFVDAFYRDDMLAYRPLNLTYDEYNQQLLPYRCPTCASRFSLLSGLVQHVYGPACGQTMAGGAMGKLIHFVQLRLRYYG
ncbi:MAG: hypothetical protein M1826_004920 [Phylliscum demangeonii]|nr:MAG: hypothetical protein M1826_004920 [Phylliscum demangeonii]